MWTILLTYLCRLYVILSNVFGVFKPFLLDLAKSRYECFIASSHSALYLLIVILIQLIRIIILNFRYLKKKTKKLYYYYKLIKVPYMKGVIQSIKITEPTLLQFIMKLINLEISYIKTICKVCRKYFFLFLLSRFVAHLMLLIYGIIFGSLYYMVTAMYGLGTSLASIDLSVLLENLPLLLKNLPHLFENLFQLDYIGFGINEVTNNFNVQEAITHSMDSSEISAVSTTQAPNNSELVLLSRPLPGYNETSLMECLPRDLPVHPVGSAEIDVVVCMPTDINLLEGPRKIQYERIQNALSTRNGNHVTTVNNLIKQGVVNIVAINPETITEVIS